MVAHQTVVLQSRVRIQRLPSPQLTANILMGCHLGMALDCGLTSVSGNRGENYENEQLVRQKHTKKKKKQQSINQLVVFPNLTIPSYGHTQQNFISPWLSGVFALTNLSLGMVGQIQQISTTIPWTSGVFTLNFSGHTTELQLIHGLVDFCLFNSPYPGLGYMYDRADAQLKHRLVDC
jgi:hypothetical protein